MLKRVHKYQCSDGTLVDTLDEVKVKERNFYASQITHLIKDDKLEIKSIILAMVSDKILKHYEDIYKLAKEYKSSMDLIEEDLQLLPVIAQKPKETPSAFTASGISSANNLNKEPVKEVSNGTGINGKENPNVTHKDLKPVAANPLALQDDLATDQLAKVDIQV